MVARKQLALFRAWYYRIEKCKLKFITQVIKQHDNIAEKHNLKVLAKLPLIPKYQPPANNGMIELYDGTWLDLVAKILEKWRKIK